MMQLPERTQVRWDSEPFTSFKDATKLANEITYLFAEYHTAVKLQDGTWTVSNCYSLEVDQSNIAKRLGKLYDYPASNSAN